MAESIQKLSPHRDLQSYFFMPSAIAALSGATEQAYTLSGKWRQQFDWAVVEWTRDNTFEHPLLRYLPDGDLSGLKLTYVEQRTNCIPLESNLVPVVDWDNLRIWANDDAGNEQVYHLKLQPLATPVDGSYTPASAVMTLVTLPPPGNRVGLALLENHHYYIVQSGDTLKDVARGIENAINGNSEIVGNPDFSASSNGAGVKLTWKPGGLYSHLLGENGNRMTVYGFAQGGTNVWAEAKAVFSGGQFPSAYQISIDFGALKAQGYPTDRVRKLRWTWVADLQPGNFEAREFQVAVTNWTVTGTNRQYFVAGPGSRRIEDTDDAVSYGGSWTCETGNYSGSKIHRSGTKGDTVSLTYNETAEHALYLGTRRYAASGAIAVAVDGRAVNAENLALPGEDVMIRLPLGTMPAGIHTVTLTNVGSPGTGVYFDFLEIAYPSQTLPGFSPQQQIALATDWDTYHSQSLPAERTAWMIQKLGFHGRVNHYAGALWFGEIVRPGTQYASTTLTFAPESFTGSPTVILNIAADNTSRPTSISHLVLLDDTTETVVIALAGLINVSTNLVWASANRNQLTLTARAMGTDGNGILAGLAQASQGFAASGSTTLRGGINGHSYGLDASDTLNAVLMATADCWRTDLTTVPRLNRAARDWHAAYFAALRQYGLDVVAAFSTELLNADPSIATGIAQRYPDGSPVVLNTPAVQTNFSPVSRTYWSQAYLDMANLQSAAGLQPYLQFGEVQWWYFGKRSTNPVSGETVDIGMPFYDDYTIQEFSSRYGRPLPVIPNNSVEPGAFAQELGFLSGLIGDHTAAIRTGVSSRYPGGRFEVLYPTDTNSSPFNAQVNFPERDWTSANLQCLKTESFTYTGDFRLDLSASSMATSAEKSFPNGQRSHLVGISDAWTSWAKEVNLAQAQGMESVVLFALDQYSLIGYGPAPFLQYARSTRQG